MGKAKIKVFKEFGLDVRAKRRALELSQDKIAKKVGMARYSVVKMEQGLHVPRGDKFVRLVKLLELNSAKYQF